MDPALSRAVDWLLEHQDPAGWWCGEFETNVTITAEHILLLRFLGLDPSTLRDAVTRYLLGQQREDGSWALYYEGPADLSTSIEAYAALKVLGLDPSSKPMRRALQVIHDLGGVAQARVFTRIWLAMFGQYPWDSVPSMPPELIWLPPSAPFNLYDFACWARATIAPLLIILARRPVRPLGCDLGELVLPGSEHLLTRVPGSGPFWWGDKVLKRYDHLVRHPGRDRACQRIVEWITARQEADGSWGGIQSAWVMSLIALHLEGLPLDHPVMRAGLAGFDRVALEDERGWRLQASTSPVWDTAWAVLALRRAGLPREHPRLALAVDWLLQEQIPGGGDWQVRTGTIPGGGWAFEFDNDHYPDIDDTAVVVLALLEAGHEDRVRNAVERAARWILAMRSTDGGWGAFDRDNTREVIHRLPIADFGTLIDPPSEDVTAHVLEMLARLSFPSTDPVVARGLEFLQQTQRPDGAWFGRWGVNYIYGTWCAVSALTAFADTDATARAMVPRAVAWLLDRQNADGGWGETCGSYEDPNLAGVGRSTPSQTAWAVLALQAAGLGQHPACRRGLDFLRERQVGGTWEEREHTGTGFPGDFFINYHLYRHVFPTMALAGAATGLDSPR